LIASATTGETVADAPLSLAAPGVGRNNMSETVWQHPLPLPWRRSPSAENTCFAHPAEAELARILTFHGVRWVYEPTTFVLERDAADNPMLCFNPDFYLPDHNRYLELTTMRQAHVTRKNRKLRLLRERYPSVDAHILYRRDFERLADRCRMQSNPDAAATGDTLFSAGQIDGRVREIAAQLEARDAPDVVVSLGVGGIRFASELVGSLASHGVRPMTGEMSLAGADVTSTARRLRVHRGPRISLHRRRVLVVTDVVSTGLTADFAVRWLAGRGAGPVEVVAMVDRAAARIVALPVRASAFTVGDVVLAGHGTTVGGRHGELADIVEVRRDGGGRAS
jgi:hypoxanthine phosphoribosyltransferase